MALEEIVYEGYGPNGIAMILEALTDNRNRTVSEIRHVFSRLGGNLGESGCVSWMFSRTGYVALLPGDADPEEVALEAIDAGAEDVEISDSVIEVYTRLMKRLVDQTRRNQQRGITTFKTNEMLQEYLDKSLLKMGLNMLLQSLLNRWRSAERQVMLP